MSWTDILEALGALEELLHQQHDVTLKISLEHGVICRHGCFKHALECGSCKVDYLWDTGFTGNQRVEILSNLRNELVRSCLVKLVRILDCFNFHLDQLKNRIFED